MTCRLQRTMLAAAALSTLLACRSSSPGLPDEDVPAGQVVGLEGEVRITTPEATRDLRFGDEVAGRDIIQTGADGSVRIAFEHNGAVWELGPDKRRRVADSIAWKAPRQSKGSPLDKKIGPDRSMAAGRHADREAADTRATIMTPNITATDPLAQDRTPDDKPGAEETIADGYLDESDLDPPAPERAISGKMAKRRDGRGRPSGGESAPLDDTRSDPEPVVPPGEDKPDNTRTDETDEVELAKPVVRKLAARSSFAPTPEPRIAIRIKSGTLDKDALETLRKSVFQRIRSQQVCGLIGVSTRVSAVLGKDSSLALSGDLPGKDDPVAPCVKAAFTTWRVPGVTPDARTILTITITWPEKP